MIAQYISMARRTPVWPWSLVAGGALAISFVFPSGGLPGLPLCWFHAWYGFPCAGCGLTRSVCAISHGHFNEAWRMHPFGFIVYLILWLMLFFPLLRRIAPQPSSWLENGKHIGWLAMACTAAIMIFGVIRWVSMRYPAIATTLGFDPWV